MIAVSNTTPLRYLIAIGQDDLLGRLFEKVFVRTGVHEELTDPGRRRPCAATSCRDQPGLRFVPCEKLTQRSFQSRHVAPEITLLPNRCRSKRCRIENLSATILGAKKFKRLSWHNVRARVKSSACGNDQ